MSRFIHQLPFSPLYDFQVCRVVTINGVNYVPGDRLDTAARDSLGDRRLRQMYERRTLTPIAPGQLPALVVAGPVQGAEVVVADGAAAETPVDETPAPTEPAATPALRAEHKGFGRWFVVAADGTEEGPMSKEQAEAKAAA